MRKPTPAMLQRIADNLDPSGGAARISGLRVRPPCISQEEYDAATARGEPAFTMRGALTIMRPVTEEMAVAEELLKVDKSTRWVKD